MVRLIVLLGNGKNNARTVPSRLPSSSFRFRPFSSRIAFHFANTHFTPVQSAVLRTQSRNFSNGQTSHNVLAHMEQTANNNPSSPSSQNAFYSALLRANMPEILVERYETGRYATNAACDAMYHRALERMNQAPSGGSINRQPELSQQQLQDISRAVAASARGATTATASGGSTAPQTGNRISPLHVVVDEPFKSQILKFVRFLLIWGLVGYFAMVLLTLAIEAFGLIRKVGGPQNAQVKAEKQKARFEDVQGCDEAKEELQEIVDFLRSPDKYNQLGGKLPKGVLMVGPPGTGKTLLARAVAGEAGVPFFYMSGSEFDEVYVGVGAKRVRELFGNAKAKAPAIVFIDELDAAGGKRNERDASYHMQTLNQILTELDGFDQTTGVVFIGATNFPQMLDKALTRPGRFDRQIVVGLPDVRGRVDILKHYMKKVSMGTDVDPSLIARGTPGFSGADLENLVNQAAVHASKKGGKTVGMLDLEWAKDRVLMGAEKKSMVIQDDEKLMTAYHEAGHALVAMFTKDSDPLYKCTIMPRGPALGVTFSLPEMDRHSNTKNELLATIDMCMGGKLAEELVYGSGKVTSGCSSDLSKATQMAYHMVMHYGMSEALGAIAFDNQLYQVLSTATKQTIENEVRRFLDEGERRAKSLLMDKRKELDLLAQALIKYETLNRDEMDKVVRGEELSDRTPNLPGVPIKVPELPPLPGLGGQGGGGPGGEPGGEGQQHPPPVIPEPAGR